MLSKSQQMRWGPRSAHHVDPKPFIWTARASDILAKVTRAKAALAATEG